MPYFDTSVVAAYYCPEPLSSVAERALLKASLPTISPLVEVEITSAVARKLRERAIEHDDAVRVLASFRAHVSQGAFALAPVTTYHYTAAANWIGLLSVPLRTLDALHIAVAAEIGEELITADRQMASSAKALKVRCRLLR
jgi:uncharacterized protein